MTTRDIAIELRRKGKTYAEILDAIGNVPKSTLSYWLADIELSTKEKGLLELNIKSKVNIGLQKAALKRKEENLTRLRALEKENLATLKRSLNKDTSKLILAALYLAEGSKRRRGSLTFGNSDPGIISLFLKLLRACYGIDELKFRCTVQCRDGQDTEYLEDFWSRLTNIPRNKFYKARIDPRTNGKGLKHPNYKGVCRIDYFSARVYNDLTLMGNLLTGR